MSELFAALSAPFDPEIVSWRVGSTTKKKWEKDNTQAKRGQPLCYIDARDVMQRLDDVCTPSGWQNRYVNMQNGTMCCEIDILVDGQWITKSNGAGATDMEGDKGAYSDALKRAAVLWGVGRYLYDIKAPWVALTDYWTIPDSEVAKLRALLPNGVALKSKADSRYEYDRIVQLMRHAVNAADLREIWKTEQHLIKTFPSDWQSTISQEKDRIKDQLMEKAA